MAVIRKKPTTAVMTNLYDTINKLYTSKEYYYTEDEVKELKDNPNNIFIERDKQWE
jgi:hypothetical protein